MFRWTTAHGQNINEDDDYFSAEDEDNSEDDECIGKSHALNAKSRMTLMCLQVALNRAPLENCRDKTEASAQVLLEKLWSWSVFVDNDAYDNDDDFDDNAVQNLMATISLQKIWAKEDIW